MHHLRKGLLTLSMAAVLLQPLFPVLVLAADEETLSLTSRSCLDQVADFYERGITPDTNLASEEVALEFSDPNSEPSAEELADLEAVQWYKTMDPELADPGDYTSPFAQEIDLGVLSQTPGADAATISMITGTSYVESVIQIYGVGNVHYTGAGKNLVVTCLGAEVVVNEAHFDPFLPEVPDFYALSESMQMGDARIAFTRPQDKYYLLGEPCTGGLISTPASGWTSDTNPCPGFNPETDDKIRTGKSLGKWDAPKVDVRVYYTLLYLVTPIELGGAGREYIKVGRLVDAPNESALGAESAVADIPQEEVSISEDEEATSNTAEGEILSFSEYQAQVDTAAPDLIGYDIDPDDEPHLPTKIAKSLSISEIDKIRSTTKITKFIGIFGNKNREYNYYAPYPVKVAWQTEAGASAQSQPSFAQPEMNLLANSRFLANQAVIQMLNQNGLGDLEIDPSKTEINSLTDVAQLVGTSLLEQLIGTPGGSLKGWDLTSTLDQIGRAYLEQQTGLAAGSLSEGDDFQSLVRSIGRRTIENQLALPQDSLRNSGGSSDILLENVGKRWLESEVLQISAGSLDASTNYPTTTVADILERVGEGRIEKVLKLPKQSMRKRFYDSANTAESLRSSSVKAGLTFPKITNATLKDEDYLSADYLNSLLSISFSDYNGSGLTMYGFTKQDIRDAAVNFFRSGTDANGVKKFKQIVGSKVLENSLGNFHLTGTTIPVTKEKKRSISVISNDNPAPEKDSSGNAINYDENTRVFPISWYQNIPIGDHDALGRGTLCGSLEDGSAKAVRTRFESPSGNRYSVVCQFTDEVASDTSDLTFFTDLRDYLLKREVETVTEFRADDSIRKAPVYADYVKDGDIEKGQRRFNHDYVSYINDTRLNQTVPKNGVVTPGSAPSQTQITSEGASTGSVQSARAFLDGNEKLRANTLLQQRLSYIANLEAAQSQVTTNGVTTNLLDLSPIMNLAGEQLQSELAIRLNAIRARPEVSRANPALYQEQYANTSIPTGEYTSPSNGWLFTLGDLKNQLLCARAGGVWTFNSTTIAYQCSTARGALLDASTSAAITQVVTYIDRLTTKLTSLSNALSFTLGEGAVCTGGEDESSEQLCGTSGAAQALEVAGVMYEVDGNGRINIANIAYSKDPIRDIFTPVMKKRDGKVIGVDTTATVKVPGAVIGGVIQPGVVSATQKTYWKQLGLLVVSKQFTNGNADKQTVAATLQSDFTEFTSALEQIRVLPIDDSKMRDAGLSVEDFSRIFQMGLGDEVYERYGREQLLIALWNKTGASEAIRNSKEYQGTLSELNQVAQDVSFYMTRIEKLTTKNTGVIDQLIANTKALADGLKSAGKISEAEYQDMLNQYRASERVQAEQRATAPGKPNFLARINSSAKSIQEAARSHEPAIRGLYLQVSSIRTRESIQGTDSLGVLFTKQEDLLEQAVNLVQEIAAGKQLPSPTYDGVLTGGIDRSSGLTARNFSTTTCFPDGNVMQILIRDKKLLDTTGAGEKKSFGQQLAEFGLYAGACRVDLALGLPTGTIFGWYSLGQKDFPPTTDATAKPPVNPHPSLTVNGSPAPGVPSWKRGEWSSESLGLAVGIGDAIRSGSRNVSYQKAHELTAEQIDTLIKNGKRILKNSLIASILKKFPGIERELAKANLSVDDLEKILQGDQRPLAHKIGGPAIDRGLDFPPGTGYALLVPTCRDNSGGAAACTNDPDQPGTNPDNIRLQTLARVGFLKIGAEIPDFPADFDLLAGGNLAGSWGTSRISSALGLASNSFGGVLQGSTSLTTSSTNKGSRTVSGNCSPDTITPEACQLEANAAIAQVFRVDNPNRSSFDSLYSELIKFIPAKASSELADTDTPDPVQVAIQQYLYQTGLGLYTTPLAADLISTTNITQAANNIAGGAYYYYLYEPFIAPGKQGLAAELWKLLGDASFYNNASDSRSRTLQARKLLLQRLYGETSIRDLSEASLLGESIPVAQPNRNDYVQKQASAATTTILGARQRVASLNTTLKLNDSAESIANGTADLYLYLKGTKNGDLLAEKVGRVDAGGGILERMIDKYITEGSAPEWLKEGAEVFKSFSKDVCFGGEVTIGKFLSSAVTGGGEGACFAENLSTVSMGKVLNDPQYEGFRGVLFDKFLARTLSAQLEGSIGLDTGTLKTIFTTPSKAKQILTNQGVRHFADQLFGRNTSSSCYLIDPDPAKCSETVLRSALREAYMAGFCDPTTGNCTTTFNRNRSSQAWQDITTREVDTQLQRATGKYLGVEIGRTDVNSLIRGEGSFFGFIGMQLTAKQINDRLAKNPATSSNRNRHKFTINYDDIRKANGLTPLSREDQINAYSWAQSDYVNTAVAEQRKLDVNGGCDLLAQCNARFEPSSSTQVSLIDEDPTERGKLFLDWAASKSMMNVPAWYDLAGLTDVADTSGDGKVDAAEAKEFIKTEQGQDILFEESLDTLDQVGEVGISQRKQEVRKEAGDALKYKAIDAVAFTADQNTPVDFSRRLFEGSEVDQMSVLVEYGLNSLFQHDSAFRNSLQSVGIDPADLGKFVVNLADALSTKTDQAQKLADLKAQVGDGFMNQVDEGFSGFLASSVFNTSRRNVPSGLFKGIYHWMESGFTKKALLSRGEKDGNNNIISVGGILDEYASNLSYNWGDKVLGAKPGTTKEVVKVGKTLYQVYKLSTKKIPSAEDIKKRFALQGELVNLAAKMLVNAFEKQLSEANRSLGLPQGSLEQLVTIGVTYLAASMGLITLSTAAVGSMELRFFTYSYSE